MGGDGPPPRTPSGDQKKSLLCTVDCMVPASKVDYFVIKSDQVYCLGGVDAGPVGLQPDPQNGNEDATQFHRKSVLVPFPKSRKRPFPDPPRRKNRWSPHFLVSIMSEIIIVFLGPTSPALWRSGFAALKGTRIDSACADPVGIAGDGLREERPFWATRGCG